MKSTNMASRRQLRFKHCHCSDMCSSQSQANFDYESMCRSIAKLTDFTSENAPVEFPRTIASLAIRHESIIYLLVMNSGQSHRTHLIFTYTHTHTTRWTCNVGLFSFETLGNISSDFSLTLSEWHRFNLESSAVSLALCLLRTHTHMLKLCTHVFNENGDGILFIVAMTDISGHLGLESLSVSCLLCVFSLSLSLCLNRYHAHRTNETLSQSAQRWHNGLVRTRPPCSQHTLLCQHSHNHTY